MRGVVLPFVSFMLFVAFAGDAFGQSRVDDTRPDTVRPEYGWVVASTSNLGTAKSVAARFASNDAPSVAVVPVVIGNTRMFRVVVGRHPDFDSALDSKAELPDHAPADTWLAELPPAMTDLAANARSTNGGVTAPGARTTSGTAAEMAQSRPALDSVDTPDSSVATPTGSGIDGDSVKAAPPTSAPQHVEFTVSTKQADIEALSPLRKIRRDNLTVELGYLSRFDSNIDHNQDDQDSFGFVPALLMQVRSSRIKPIALLNYHVARHNYSGTDRWDRFSHLLIGIFRQDQDGALRTETRGEISVAGTSEDRDLSNQYQVQQDLEYRFTRDYRLHLYGTLRWKRYDVRDRNEFKPNVGVEFEQRMDNGTELEFGVRWETKIIDERNSRYKRWTFSMDYEIPVSATSELEFSIENRRKMYEFKEVEIEDEDFLRRDFRWRFGAALTKQLSDRLLLQTDYKFERRDSNDPEKLFDAHLFDVSVRYRL